MELNRNTGGLVYNYLAQLANEVTGDKCQLEIMLSKLGLGINDCNKIEKGECLCLGKGLYLGTDGSGLFLGPKSGSGLFLGPSP